MKPNIKAIDLNGKEHPMDNDKFSPDFYKGEQALAKAILERIEKGKDIGYIEMLCLLVLKENETKNSL